ncbi:MAG: hypothetical protein IPF62_15140 [Bacteroidetes bacterium]|jgi:hypothetical protein|nr:hypothetical protein [Bacteroidota bacterium]MBK6818867.1 hypothetical protein [Bacteroidota bacterium]MBK7041540.1 hypothetical protein [Bacteroidota bacterium]MBK7588460.1 hypothetical protein [Bacteroidota bacterium]
MSLFIANKIKQLISEYVHLLVIILLMVCITACTPTDQHKSSRTRSFKLTEDSTFIGAWGGVLENYPNVLHNDHYLVFIYSKNNKIYVPDRPKYFDTTKDEKEALVFYYSFLEDSRGEHGWNNNFIMESETQMSEYYTSLKHCYRYKIDDSDNLIFSKEVFENNGKDTFHVEYYKFKPYYFKTIKNL